VTRSLAVRVAVTRLGLVEGGAEVLGIDPSLDAGELTGFEHLSADAERPLEPDGFLELGTHRGGDANDDATVDVARLAADGVAEAPKDGERPHDHAAGFRRRVELADDPDRPAGAAGREEVALEQKDVAHARTGQVEGDGGAGDAATDDDDLGVADHLAVAVTSAASASSSKRTLTDRACCQHAGIDTAPAGMALLGHAGVVTVLEGSRDVGEHRLAEEHVAPRDDATSPAPRR